MSGLISHGLVTSGLGFKLSSEHEKSNDNVLSATKDLVANNLSRHGIVMSMPYLVLHLDRVCWCWGLMIFY